MSTHESYVSLETAKMLKEAGFDWDVNTCYYYSSPDKVSSNGTLTSNFNGYAFQHIAISAPTLSVAQKWLREEKEMYAEAYLSESHHTAVWIAEVYLWENRPLGRELRDKCLCTGIGPVYFNTYEEALEAGINKCLTLILKEEVII